jgi:hypothetical protein
LLHFFTVNLNLFWYSSQSLKEVFDSALIILEDILNGVRVFDEFKHAIILTESKHLIGCKLKVQIYLLEKIIHELYDLKHQLVLAHVISRFKDHTVLLRWPYRRRVACSTN